MSQVRRCDQRVEVWCPHCNRTRVVLYYTAIRNGPDYEANGLSCKRCNYRSRKYSTTPDRDKLRELRLLADATPVPASGPTRADPGSDEKIAVMHERYMNGEAVLHPDDPTLTPPRATPRTVRPDEYKFTEA